MVRIFAGENLNHK